LLLLSRATPTPNPGLILVLLEKRRKLSYHAWTSLLGRLHHLPHPHHPPLHHPHLPRPPRHPLHPPHPSQQNRPAHQHQKVHATRPISAAPRLSTAVDHVRAKVGAAGRASPEQEVVVLECELATKVYAFVHSRPLGSGMRVLMGPSGPVGSGSHCERKLSPGNVAHGCPHCDTHRRC
jgi:hypothetical protein